MQTPAPGARFSGFEVLSVRPLPEFRGEGVRCRHLATGLEAFHLACEDPENLFAFAFRTPPPDDSGVAHILEHSVLCGSRRYPVKDPFVVLLKSSLQTFLNAFTFPDKTVYPAASQLEKDFFNLLAVYGDAVFFPRLSPEVFHQEGHRLEFAPDGSLSRVGVVYNEMKGSFSSAETIVADLSLRSLFPAGPYGRESGGLPARIPALSYEGLVEFHRRCYHPSNCLLFLYGNVPTQKTLAFLSDSFLEGFAVPASGGPEGPASPPGFAAVPAIPREPRWSAPRFAETVYPVEEGSEGSSKSSLTVNWLTVPVTEPLLLLAMELLGEVLVGNPGSPLSRALLESGLGQDLSPATGLDTELAELVFTAGLRGCEAGRATEVQEVVLRSLEQLASGIPEELVRGAVHRVDFRNREIVRGGRPFSLSLMRRSLRGWLHGREPELTLEYRKWMEALQAELDRGPYLENLLRAQLLENPHRSTVLVRPDPQAAARQLAEERAGLEQIARSLGPEERSRVEQENRLLRSFQESPDRPEDLATLPRLRRADLPHAVDTVPTSDLPPPGGFFHELHTNGVVYLDLALEVSRLGEPASALLPLWARAVCGSGLPGQPWHQTASRLSLVAGGFSAALGADTPAGASRPAQHLIFRLKALEENLEPALQLVASLLVEADFRDLERLEMLVQELRNDLKSALVPGGSYFASLRAGGRLSEAINREERWKGVSQLAHLRRHAGRPALEGLAGELEGLRAALIGRNRFTLNLTCDARAAGRAEAALRRFLDRLPAGGGLPAAAPAGAGGPPPALSDGQRLEALLTSTNVNFAALALPASAFGTEESVQEAILAHFLSTGFLWEQVRMKGGAYGAGASVSSLERVFTFSSYRDPNIARTFDSFRQALEAARAQPLSPEAFEQVLIGAVGREERPMAPGERGYTALKRALLAISDRMRQDRRDRLLASTPEDLAAAAGRLASRLQQGYAAVLTGRQALESSGLRDLDLVEIAD
jgi:Zn-dependent M16 (insulinase) family peptidase